MCPLCVSVSLLVGSVASRASRASALGRLGDVSLIADCICDSLGVIKVHTPQNIIQVDIEGSYI